MKKNKKWLITLATIIGLIVVIYLGGGLANYICNINLRNYIDSFEAVEYPADRLVPEIDENGHYSFITDADFKIMQLTDVHIGGGIFSYKRDKKAIYEIITMLHEEKPDLVILGGDNTYALFKIGYNGGGTFNNKMAATTLISLFEHEQVYFSTVLGNHDTEFIDYYNREKIGELYADEKYKYSVFKSEFTDPDAATVPSVSNQFILLKNTSGEITKLILLIDTNAYIDTGLISSARGLYDTIHQSEVDWAKEEIIRMSDKQGLAAGEYLKSLVFLHIPPGEYQTAYDDLIELKQDENGKDIYISKEETGDTSFIEGGWDEKVYFGGISNVESSPAEQDNFIETIGLEMGSIEAVFCGHDHVNNAVVNYKGIILSYNYSIDNIAYGNEISEMGSQRGNTTIVISPDGDFSITHNNAYKEYNIDPDKFVHVNTDAIYNPDTYRTYTK